LVTTVITAVTKKKRRMVADEFLTELIPDYSAFHRTFSENVSMCSVWRVATLQFDDPKVDHLEMTSESNVEQTQDNELEELRRDFELVVLCSPLTATTCEIVYCPWQTLFISSLERYRAKT